MNVEYDSTRRSAQTEYLPCQHFKDENTQGPPINSFTMSFALNDFRSQVFWGTT